MVLSELAVLAGVCSVPVQGRKSSAAPGLREILSAAVPLIVMPSVLSFAKLLHQCLCEAAQS